MSNENEKPQVYCPYCDEELEQPSSAQCGACGVEMFYCPRCGQSVAREQRVCPHCGADIKQEASREK